MIFKMIEIFWVNQNILAFYIKYYNIHVYMYPVLLNFLYLTL